MAFQRQGLRRAAAGRLRYPGKRRHLERPRDSTSVWRSLSEFAMTLKEDSAIAAAAMAGESSKPNAG